MGVTYESTYEPSKELIDLINEGLRRYNESVVGKSESIPVASFARDEAGQVVGGVSGWIFWDWLYIDKLWVDERQRDRGIGTRLMLEAERMAADKGIDKSSLCTGSFQALGFYEGLGYSIVCEIEDQPRGHSNYFMRKNLEPRA